MWYDKGNLLRPQVSVWQSFLLPPIVLDGSHLYIPVLGLGTGAETGREVSGLGSGGVLCRCLCRAAFVFRPSSGQHTDRRGDGCRVMAPFHRAVRRERT